MLLLGLQDTNTREQAKWLKELVRVEAFRLRCMRIIRHLVEAGDREIDLILSKTRFFLLISKETEAQA